MKRDMVLSAGFLILLVILIVGVVLLPARAQTITASVKFSPHFIDLGRPPPSVVKATIRFEEADVADINSSTILLDGTLPPSTTYLIPGGLVAEFDGYMVANILNAKIAHMGIAPPYKVWLTITGNLYDYAGGNQFSGSGYIKAWAPHSPPPP
jgi:hypothetical protein